MLHVGHEVMYYQLSGWLLHGLLLDKYNEFFIHANRSAADDASEANATEDSDDVLLGGVTMHDLQQTLVTAPTEFLWLN